MVGAHFASNGCPDVLGLVDEFHRSPGADVEDVDGAVGFQGENAVASDVDFFSGAGHSFQPQHCGHRSFIHTGAFGQGCVFTVGCNG